MNNQNQNLTSPEIEAKIAEKAKQHAMEDEAGRRAASTPLPGATRDAFAIQPDIKVGSFNVRPFYDIDFEFLSMLEHPLHKMMVNGMKGEKAEDEFFPRGSMVWELAFVFTRSPDDVEAAFKAGGVSGVKNEAKKQFSRFQLAALTQLSQAVIKQMSIYWEPVVAYGVPEKEGEAKHPNPS